MKKIINCITIGDEKGIGLELIFKIWNNYKNRTKTFFILGDYKIINENLLKYQFRFNLKKIDSPEHAEKYFNNFLPIIDLKSKNKKFVSIDSIIKSYELAKNNQISGVITLPINKEKIISINNKFIDHTNFYETIDNTSSNMIFYSKNIIISPLTTHIPINKVSSYINKRFIKNKLILLIKTLENDFKIKKPKIIVSGLNPHAGESGKIGKEEEEIIIPVIKYLKQKNFNVYGPASADSLFTKKNIDKFDCILTMYHDQALIPFKLLNFNNGVNFTSGLSFIRTSPCHGTAYDLVGTNKASESSLLNAILLANKIFLNRNYVKKISRTKFSY
tara:strand:+ start:2999 stop:3994 length:996 start_codon:yes stop_codon:yes gene_type:complete